MHRCVAVVLALGVAINLPTKRFICGWFLIWLYYYHSYNVRIKTHYSKKQQWAHDIWNKLMISNESIYCFLFLRDFLKGIFLIRSWNVDLESFNLLLSPFVSNMKCLIMFLYCCSLFTIARVCLSILMTGCWLK